MKRIIILLSLFILLFSSCDNNVYIDENIDNPVTGRDIWRIGESYFETANDAINHIIENSRSRGMAKTDDENRTVILTRPVLAEGSDGIIDSSYEEYIEDESLRRSITVPATFSGDLTIDFGGFRYDFADTSEAFFVVDGGDNVYIYNGTSVIFEDANAEPYAISVNTDTVTIDEHLVDDRRTSPRAVEVKTNGAVVITAEAKKENTGIKGEFSIDGSLKIEDGVINITKVETTQDSSFSITGGKIINPHEYDDIIASAIDKDAFEANGGEHTPEHVIITCEAKNPTCTEAGWDKYEYCEYCEYTTKVEKAALGHNLETHVSGKDATCTEDGNREYWQCSRCFGYFSDELADNEIADRVVIAKLGHDESGDWVSTDPENHWKICKRKNCGEKLDIEGHKYTTWAYSESDTLWHRTCSVCGRAETDSHVSHRLDHHSYTAPTCTEEGNYEYWQCSICSKYFSDRGQTGIADIVIDALGHDWPDEWTTDGDYHWKVCQREGCGGIKDEAEHTNEYYYSAENKKADGIPFLTISYKCNVCSRKVDSVYEKESGVFHVTPTDGIDYKYDSSTATVTLALSQGKSYSHLRWYDKNGKRITKLDDESAFRFTLSDRYGYRCELLNADNKVIGSCYIELW